MKALFLAFLICCLGSQSFCAGNKSFSEWYEVGRLAYLDNDWEQCVQGFEKALTAYKTYKNISLGCKRMCQQNTTNQHILTQVNLEDDLQFYQKKILYTLCNIKCKAASPFFVRDDDFVNKTVLEHFEGQEPYNYLQLCYHQLKQHAKSLEAAFTYYVTHHDDEVAKTNLEYYMEITGEARVNAIQNMEAFEHTHKFYEAKEFYENGGKWNEAILGFEDTLKAYLEEMENCRLSCEKPFDQGWYPDFISSTANHFTFCLKCKSQCEETMSNLDGNIVPDFLPLIYNYLQYSYYKAGDMTKAAECVASFLLFLPKDKAMLNNKNYFTEELGLSKNVFNARPEAMAFKNLQDSEKYLLDFIDREFASLSKFDEDDGGQGISRDEL